MLNASMPPGRSTRNVSRMARSNRGPSISDMNETTASKLASPNVARSVYEAREKSIPRGSRRSSARASAIIRSERSIPVMRAPRRARMRVL